mmetsp:Transcript_39794/g.88451  ORF Transcript_39794/g.88451 Transcript_39794/m.88451 type:complete len:254 (+) Transcript_39794:658-1419(+)
MCRLLYIVLLVLCAHPMPSCHEPLLKLHERKLKLVLTHVLPAAVAAHHTAHVGQHLSILLPQPLLCFSDGLLCIALQPVSGLSQALPLSVLGPEPGQCSSHRLLRTLSGHTHTAGSILLSRPDALPGFLKALFPGSSVGPATATATAATVAACAAAACAAAVCAVCAAGACCQRVHAQQLQQLVLLLTNALRQLGRQGVVSLALGGRLVQHLSGGRLLQQHLLGSFLIPTAHLLQGEVIQQAHHLCKLHGGAR